MSSLAIFILCAIWILLGYSTGHIAEKQGRPFLHGSSQECYVLLLLFSICY